MKKWQLSCKVKITESSYKSQADKLLIISSYKIKYKYKSRKWKDFCGNDFGNKIGQIGQIRFFFTKHLSNFTI